MNTEKICVIGASGFVGSHVTAELLSRGCEVHGTLRDASGPNSRWLMADVAAAARERGALTLYTADIYDRGSLKAAMADCRGVIVCAGSPIVEPQTIDLMVAIAENVSEVALELGIGRAVFTSSTGSTNPPQGEPALKNEVQHWSDPELQRETGKFAAVGKTLMDRIVLGKMDASAGNFRVCTINPSMIVGPAYQAEPVTSLGRFAEIIGGQRMAETVPNSSMSMIDARDLARLHVNALENDRASGRYFGVKQSWHWREILDALARACPAYRAPAADPGEIRVRPTQFDLTRQATLGVSLRGLDEMLEGVVGELKRRTMIE